jgi:hypothetical protein
MGVRVGTSSGSSGRAASLAPGAEATIDNAATDASARRHHECPWVFM